MLASAPAAIACIIFTGFRMIRILSTREMQVVEQSAVDAGISTPELMQNAGTAVADVVMSFHSVGNHRATEILVLVGNGNNGGDGLVAATKLKEATDADVHAYLISPRPDEDRELATARNSGVTLHYFADDSQLQTLTSLTNRADIIVDSLLGTGVHLPIRDDVATILRTVQNVVFAESSNPSTSVVWASATQTTQTFRKLVVAVDCPSGMDCDTGEVAEETIRSDVTVTFGGVKYGHIRFPGAGYCGELAISLIGIPSNVLDSEASSTVLVTPMDVANALPDRPIDGHKGTFGRLTIASGSNRFVGAASLAGLAAYLTGVGLVQMAVPELIIPIVASGFPEAIWQGLPSHEGALDIRATSVLLEAIAGSSSVLIGPGLGQSHGTQEFFGKFMEAHSATKHKPDRTDSLKSTSPRDKNLPYRLVIDADGLNLLSKLPNWWDLLPPETVLTPHVKEMCRLTGLDRETVLSTRIDLTRQMADSWKCVVILKGPFSVVAAPGEQTAIIPFATDALAKAGTGDALAGCVAGLIAQGCASYPAAFIGGYIHGLAGTLATKSVPSRSVLARDVLHNIPAAFKKVESQRTARNSGPLLIRGPG